jgi:hypothetical protein
VQPAADDLWSRLTSGPSIAAQVDKINREARAEGRRMIVQRRVAFRGTAHDSLLVVLRDRSSRLFPAGDLEFPRSSDELRIYDIDGSSLRQRFAFQPQDPGKIRQAPEGDSPSFRFSLRAIGDFDNDGKLELVAALERVTLASGPYPVPVLVRYSDAAQRYRMTPLLPFAPQLQRPLGVTRAELTGYTKPTRIVNRRGSPSRLLGYAVDQYDFRATLRAPVFAAAFNTGFLRQMRGVAPYEVRAWYIDLQDSPTRLLDCYPLDGRHPRAAPSGPSPLRTLFAGAFRAGSDCVA